MGLQVLVGRAAHGVLHDIVVLAMQAQHRNPLLAGGKFQLVAEGWRIGGEGKYATERSLPFEERAVQDHRATLGKAGQENSRGVYSAGALLFDQINDPLC
ncbi:hypothetical protein D3C85_1027960 [compost metagenome]